MLILEENEKQSVSLSVVQLVRVSWNHLVTCDFFLTTGSVCSTVTSGSLETLEHTDQKINIYIFFCCSSVRLSVLIGSVLPASIVNHNSRSPLMNVGKAVEHEATLPGGGGDIHQTRCDETRRRQ